MAIDRVPLELPPGIVRNQKDHVVEGRYIDGDKVRFDAGYPEKIGGWEKWCHEQLIGIARGLFAWTGAANNIYVAAGTQCKLYALQLPPSAAPAAITAGWGRGGWGSGGWGSGASKTPAVADLDNITPLRTSGTLTNPFTTTYNSNVVTVTHSSHGNVVGTTVNFPDATTIGEVTIQGSYVVQTVPSLNTYTIEVAQPATFTETGGGSVDYEYEILCGLADATTGRGWGIGGWGESTWGTARSGSSFVQFPRFWSLDNYGNDLLALPSGGTLYRYDPTSDTRAQPVSNAPSDNFAMFMADQGFPILLGAGGTPMKAQWPDQSDITVWTPSATNTARSRTLRTGSRLMGGTAFSNLVSLVWSDTAIYQFLYRGTGQIMEVRLLGKACGLVGPKAFAIADNRGFWMSQTSFHMFNGYVTEIPNVSDIQDWVFGNLTTQQRSKADCFYNETEREVWWLFPAASSLEPNRYVYVNIDDFHWGSGTFDRTASFFLSINDSRPLMAGSDGYIYIHETGTDDDGAAMDAFIKSAPVDIGDGEMSMDIAGFIPSFKGRSGALTLTVVIRDEPDGETTDTLTDTIAEGQTASDIRGSGRMVDFEIRSNVVGGHFRFGKPLVEVEPAGHGRR